MLSLPSRSDLFEFRITKTFIPPNLLDKYNKLLFKKKPCVFTDILDYLNESIIGVSIPGISGLNIQQPQVSHHTTLVKRDNNFDTEAHHMNSYQSPENILTKIDGQITVTFRLNQGLLNYFLLYETVFERYCNPDAYDSNDKFILYIKDENGKYISNIFFIQPSVESIDSLEMSMNKIDREAETFSVTFNFNNIDYDFYTENIGE